jgi:ATP-dependent Clp protease adaptor protein ClpS
MTQVLTPEKIAELSRKDTGHTHRLILHNDDVNTFPHIMNCLVTICKHSPVQAEQCAQIAHHNGKCEIKRGNYHTLEEMLILLRDNNVISEIQ